MEVIKKRGVMVEFLDEVDKLIKLLENTNLLKEYKSAKEKALEDKNLLQLLLKYHQGDQTVKKTVLENAFYQDYQKKSSDLSFLIWRINLKFQKLKGNFACGLSKESIKESI